MAAVVSVHFADIPRELSQGAPIAQRSSRIRAVLLQIILNDDEQASRHLARRSHESAIDIRFGQVGLVQVRIRTTDPGAILDELTGRIATAPRFFERTAVCLDLSALEKSPDVAEVRGVIDAVKRAGMLSIGLTTGSLGVEALSGALQIPVLSPFPRAEPERSRSAAAAPQPAESAGLPALMHHQTVRSGQRVYARNRDLVVTATVGAGAEVIADGCVHIYGALRGRAMAGAREDVDRAHLLPRIPRRAGLDRRRIPRCFETIPAGTRRQARAGVAGRRQVKLRALDWGLHDLL